LLKDKQLDNSEKFKLLEQILITSNGLETTFDKIISLSPHCKYKDYTHTNETGCSVLEAVKNGEVDKNSYENYLKLEREKVHFESTVAEKRNKDKAFGKMLKNYTSKNRKNGEYFTNYPKRV